MLLRIGVWVRVWMRKWMWVCVGIVVRFMLVGFCRCRSCCGRCGACGLRLRLSCGLWNCRSGNDLPQAIVQLTQSIGSGGCIILRHQLRFSGRFRFWRGNLCVLIGMMSPVLRWIVGLVLGRLVGLWLLSIIPCLLVAVNRSVN